MPGGAKGLAESYLALAEAAGGCGDGGCAILKPRGMHTNGGCRCVDAARDDVMQRRHIDRLLRAAQELARAVTAENP